MAEETPMSPISEAVPPKANPLATPATAHTATLKLNPVVRRPVTGGAGATQTALKPGVKLPPKPALAAGLKLPPKPGATVSGLKPGIKLPTQSGLKPGVKLPTKPVIHKPGEAVKPVAAEPATTAAAAPVAAPVADMKPVEEPKAAAPAAASVAEAQKPLDALKTVTQNLKSITSPIPQQAILRKTGIIADGEMTEAQKQAAKSKTARISLSDAMGVAPVKNEALPMKTIRIKRPTDIPGATNTTAKPIAPATEPAAPVDSQAETEVAAEDQQPSTSFTQRKTLKIARPGGGSVRPSGKFGVKKPTAGSQSAGEAANASAVGEIADIPEMPSVAAVAPMAPMAARATVPDVPKGVAVLGVVAQFAACLAIAALAWLLFQDTQISPF